MVYKCKSRDQRCKDVDDSAILVPEGRILVSLDVKDPRADALPTQLSEIKGDATAKRILAFSERFAPGMNREAHSSGHADLYGEDGLPK